MDNQEKMTNENNVCPCCDHHCPADNLHCSKGKEYFGLPVEEGDRERGHGEGHQRKGQRKKEGKREGRKE